MTDRTTSHTRMTHVAFASLRPRSLACLQARFAPSSLICSTTRAPRCTRPCNQSSQTELGGNGLFPGVVVKTLAGFTPVVSGRDHLAQGGRGGETALPVLVEHDVGDRLGRIQPDEVQQR